MSLKETEKAALQEKLNNLNQQIHDLGVECEKLKRQAASKQEKDRVSFIRMHNILHASKQYCKVVFLKKVKKLGLIVIILVLVLLQDFAKCYELAGLFPLLFHEQHTQVELHLEG